MQKVTESNFVHVSRSIKFYILHEFVLIWGEYLENVIYSLNTYYAYHTPTEGEFVEQRNLWHSYRLPTSPQYSPGLNKKRTGGLRILTWIIERDYQTASKEVWNPGFGVRPPDSMEFCSSLLLDVSV